MPRPLPLAPATAGHPSPPLLTLAIMMCGLAIPTTSRQVTPRPLNRTDSLLRISTVASSVASQPFASCIIFI
ncbi:uncharacterized protein G2W53_034646 [Senna tora]|uniref:Uncharacterized protein n=1 Tax=Senna tora TaxID=362788 RepID=A0A834T0Y9_9FABA|nr:uncharacterized protein G2W53_034646 [Senna tora]